MTPKNITHINVKKKYTKLQYSGFVVHDSTTVLCVMQCSSPSPSSSTRIKSIPVKNRQTRTGHFNASSSVPHLFDFSASNSTIVWGCGEQILK